MVQKVDSAGDDLPRTLSILPGTICLEPFRQTLNSWARGTLQQCRSKMNKTTGHHIGGSQVLPKCCDATHLPATRRWAFVPWGARPQPGTECFFCACLSHGMYILLHKRGRKLNWTWAMERSTEEDDTPIWYALHFACSARRSDKMECLWWHSNHVYYCTLCFLFSNWVSLRARTREFPWEFVSTENPRFSNQTSVRYTLVLC